jgi:hypothetical protein
MPLAKNKAFRLPKSNKPHQPFILGTTDTFQLNLMDPPNINISHDNLRRVLEKFFIELQNSFTTVLFRTI